MKIKYAFTLSFLLGLAMPLANSHADLISYYPLDETAGETATDAAGANDAVWQNAGLNLTWVAGRIGGAAQLVDAGGAGANNYFQLNLPELIGANAITITAWINPEAQSSSGYNGIFMTRTFNGASGNSWGLAIENNGNERFDSRVNGPGIDSPDGLLSPANGWIHIAMVWDGTTGTHTQYVNGSQTNTGGSIFGPILGPDSGPWYIGYDDCCGDTRDFDGLIDDIGIWNEVLTPAQISILAGGVAASSIDAADFDEDGLPNDFEDMFAFLDPNDDGDAGLDQDVDGLTNLQEFQRGTDLEDDDSDDDTLTDGEEVNTHGTNPLVQDTDADGINDDEELVAGADGFVTLPLVADTDLDGISDGDEVTNGTDPTDQNDPPRPEPDLIGYWPLDETDGDTAVDLINGNNGVWAGIDTANLEWVGIGQIGGAAKLTDLGGDDYFRIDTINQLISAGGLTISLWIEPDENDGYNGIFMTRTINNAVNNSWGVAFQNDGGGSNHLDTRVNGPGIDSPDDTLSPDGGWFHVAMVWDGATGTHTQYINGEETATTTTNILTGLILGTSGPWYIGYDDCCGGGRDFNGMIDDIGMWSQALNAQEIQAIYDNGVAGVGIRPGPGSNFRVTEIVYNADDTVTLTWKSDPRKGTTYTVLFSDDLSGSISTWADIDDGIATGGETTSFTTPPNTGVGRRFYAISKN